MPRAEDLCANLSLVSPTLLAALQPTWDDLWSLAEAAAALEAADEPGYVFEDIGLMLQPPVRARGDLRRDPR